MASGAIGRRFESCWTHRFRRRRGIFHGGAFALRRATAYAGCMRYTLLGLLLLLAGGCSKGISFSDDEGGPRGGADEISLPYAVGTSVNIAVKHADKAQLSSLKVNSDDPSKLSIDKLTVNDPDLTVACTAHAAGDTTIHLVDGSGRELRSAAITIVAPDKARLFAHGPLRTLGHDESKFGQAEVMEARVLAGGKGVFGVTYWKGDQRVYGRGIANADPVAGITILDTLSSNAPTNEWLFISPTVAGTAMLTLKPGGTSVLSIPLVTVDEKDVTKLELVDEITSDRSDKQKIWVAAKASDAAGNQVHGLYAGWTLDGTPQTDGNMVAQGDLYRYQFQPAGMPRQLVATRGNLMGTAKISAYDGQVGNTTYLGCSVAPGRRSRAPLALALGLLLAALLARRRFSFR
jgi:hypothetical protein